MGVPRVWSATGQVDPLTGLAPLDQLRAGVRAALEAGTPLPLVVVVAELPRDAHPLEHARRLTLAGAMGWTSFASALGVGRLGSCCVGVVNGPDPELGARTALYARMLHDLPAKVRLEPVAGSPEVADWLLRRLCP